MLRIYVRVVSKVGFYCTMVGYSVKPVVRELSKKRAPLLKDGALITVITLYLMI